LMAVAVILMHISLGSRAERLRSCKEVWAFGAVISARRKEEGIDIVSGDVCCWLSEVGGLSVA